MKLTTRQKELIAKQIEKERIDALPEFDATYFTSKSKKLEEMQKKLSELVLDIETQIKIDNPCYSNIKCYKEALTNSYYLIKSKPNYYKDIMDKIELASLDAADLTSLIEKVKQSL